MTLSEAVTGVREFVASVDAHSGVSDVERQAVAIVLNNAEEAASLLASIGLTHPHLVPERWAARETDAAATAAREVE